MTLNTKITKETRHKCTRTSQLSRINMLLSTRFMATTAAVISFFITESPMVRGPVEDMKDGRHMLSREGMTASSPRFKSKRRSEGPDIFRAVKERRGRTSQDRRSARREFLQAKIQICPHLSHATSALDGISEIEEASSDIGEASAFPDVSTFLTCRVSFTKITGSLSKR
ncbi:hypothetical protein FF1_009221 [Malus domestica]